MLAELKMRARQPGRRWVIFNWAVSISDMVRESLRETGARVTTLGPTASGGSRLARHGVGVPGRDLLQARQQFIDAGWGMAARAHRQELQRADVHPDRFHVPAATGPEIV